MVVKSHLEQMLTAYSHAGHPALLERFVIRNGKEFVGAKRPRGLRKRQDRMCYMNSTNLAVQRDWEYWEGIAISHIGFPCPHAWNVVGGVVVDSTWLKPEVCHYLGVQVSLDDLHDELIKHKVYGVFDTGLGINTEYLFKRDPELEGIVKQLCSRNANAS